jgi:hypothetical protein
VSRSTSQVGVGRDDEGKALIEPPDMMGDEADDPFAVGWRQPFARVVKPVRKPFDPDAAIWIEHDLNDRGVFAPSCDCCPQCGA